MNRIRQALLGLRFRLLLLVLLVCAPLVVLTLYTASSDKRRQLENWSQRSQRLMDLARGQEKELVGATRQLLLAMGESVAAQANNQTAMRRLAESFLAAYPRYGNLGVANTNGEVLACGREILPNLSQRRFFQQTLQTRDFAVSLAPGADRPGSPRLEFGYPIFDRAGLPAGVVFATMDLARVDWLGSDGSVQFPRGASWSQITSNGLILARFPRSEDWVGKIHPDQSMVKAAFAGPASVVQLEAPSGRDLVHAFTPFASQLAGARTMLVLSIAPQTLFMQADLMLMRNLSWLAVACGLALVFGWMGSNFLVLRPVQALARSSARLTQGDLKARTGLVNRGRDELGQLTLSFDLMAQSLETREQERLQANQKLQMLSQRLVQVQETERRQIARELHDEIGQSLTAAEMNLQAALQNPQDPAIEKRLEDSMHAVERVREQVHDLSLNLRPSMLDDLGLEPALRWYTHRQADLAGLKADFRPAPLHDRLHPTIETECFRIAQEALTNVVRHARASKVLVELTLHPDHLQLRVVDDGRGFDVRAARDRAVGGSSLGLLSMHERAALAGGQLQIVSHPGHGTELRATFPLKFEPEPMLQIHE